MKRFEIPPVPKNEVAKYVENPYETSAVGYGLTRGGDLVVNPNDDLLIQKGGASAFNVYTKLLFDETVQSALNKVAQDVTSREWKLEPAEDTPGDIAIRDFVRRILENLQLDEVFTGMIEAYIVGYSVIEVMWRRTDQGVVPYDLRFRDPRRFRFQESEKADYGFEMKMMTRDDSITGVELPPRKFIVFRYWAQSNGDPYGAGLGRVLYPLVKFKRRALESQLLYSDRFANPTAVAKAPLSATAVEIDTLYGHLSNLSQETALVMPEGFELDFVNPGGSPETFEKLRDSLIRDITILIAGEDEAGSQGAGSMASSQVAENVRLQRAKQLSDLMAFTLGETLVRWTVDLNFGTNVRHPKLWRDFEPNEDLNLDIQGVATLVKDIGLRPTTDWIKERFNVEIEEDDTIIPTGPEGTAGVDNKNEGGKTLDGMPDDVVEEEVEDDEEVTSLDDTLSDALGEERQDDGSEGLLESLRSIFGSDFSEADVDKAIELLTEGKIQSRRNSK